MLSLKPGILLCLVLFSLCIFGRAVAEEEQENTYTSATLGSDLAAFLQSQGLHFGPVNDWDSIDVEEGPFVRMSSAADQVMSEDPHSGSNPSIVQTANFRFPKTLPSKQSAGSPQYFYSRINNPNYELIERQMSAFYDVRHKTTPRAPNDLLTHIGSMDGIPSDNRAPPPKLVSFSSGMGAIAAVLGTLLKPGDKAVIADELYYEVADLGALFGTLAGTQTVAVDISDIDKVVKQVSEEHVKVLYLESASNPHGRIPDFDPLLQRVRQVNPDIIVVLDNTWTSPIIFHPFRHDIDVIVESGTKYLSGKGDALLGIAVVYNHPASLSTHQSEHLGGEEEVSEERRAVLAALPGKLRVWRRLIGSNPNPMSSWLVSKGLETLQLRMEHLSIKSPEFADFVSTLPCVTRVHYCGSMSHPHFELAQKYFRNGYCSGVMTFHLPLKNEQEVEMVMKSSSPFIPTPSFGEAQTLVMWPRSGSSRNFKGDEVLGIPDVQGYWFRFAIGLAPSEELKRDFFRWMTRLPFLTKHIASVNSNDFKRSLETGDLTLVLSTEDWKQIEAAPQPLWIKRQELADIDDEQSKHSSHPLPVRFKFLSEVGVSHVEVAFDTAHPSKIAAYVSSDAKYIISAFKKAT